MTETKTNKPTNVIEAIAAVMSEVEGVGKDRSSGGEGGPSYKYRGIEDITAALQKLLGKHGLVFIPRVVCTQSKEILVGKFDAKWNEERMTVMYTVYGPGGLEDKIEVGPFLGIGRDNSDKYTNKAMTMTFKQALLQVFCIGDSKDDAETDTTPNSGGGDGQAAPAKKAAGAKKAAPQRPARTVEPPAPTVNDVRQAHKESEAEDRAKREGATDVALATATQMKALRDETSQLQPGEARDTLVKKWTEAELPNVQHPQAVLTADQFEIAMRLALDATEAQAQAAAEPAAEGAPE